MIRPRKPFADDPFLVRLIRQELIPLNPPELRHNWPNRKLIQRLDRGTTFIWTPDDAAATSVSGFITMQVNANILFVDMLALDRTKQGRGAGSSMLNKAILWGRSHGCTVMRLYVNDTNTRGIQFYRKHGMMALYHDPNIRSYLMELPLR